MTLVGCRFTFVLFGVSGAAFVVAALIRACCLSRGGRGGRRCYSREPAAAALAQDEQGLASASAATVAPAVTKQPPPAAESADVELAAASAAPPKPAFTAPTQSPQGQLSPEQAEAALASSSFAQLFKSRSVHALLILVCIVFLKACTLLLQVRALRPGFAPTSQCFASRADPCLLFRAVRALRARGNACLRSVAHGYAACCSCKLFGPIRTHSRVATHRCVLSVARVVLCCHPQLPAAASRARS